MTQTLITNIAYGLTGDAAGSRFSGALRIKDGIITAIGALTPEAEDSIVDAAGCVVTPGLVNTHHHLFQSVLKAVPEGMNAPLDLWLKHVPYTYWPLIDTEILRTSAQIGLTELILSGATTVCDHHYVFCDRYDYDPAQVLFDTAAEFGLRFVLARGGMTKGRPFDDPGIPLPPLETLDQFLTQTARAADRWHQTGPTAMTKLAVAPTTPTFNVLASELPLIASFARDKGLRLHAHLSENKTYVDYTQSLYGLRPVPWLAQQDWLGPDVWFAHLVECTPDELRLLAETGTGMAHCPQANARLGSGIAPAVALAAAGGCVSLAVDGAGANEAADMGAALYRDFALHRSQNGPEACTAETVLHWASESGARMLGFENLGRIAVGQQADLCLFDLGHPRNMGLHDPALAPVITGAATVKHSFVAGNRLVVDGQIPGLDLMDLGERARSAVAMLKAKRAQCAT